MPPLRLAMHATTLTRFVRDHAALDEHRLTIKVVACPHCRYSGALIGHGFLRGYAETGNARIIRGRRFFCSNRYRRPGCGRTFSVLLTHLLARFVVGTDTLHRFAASAVCGVSRQASWGVASGTNMSWRSGYRLWKKLSLAQSHIKTHLLRVSEPPASTATEPIAQLLAHLRLVLPGSGAVFANFQNHFQVDLLG